MTPCTASELPVTWLLAVRNGMPFLSETLASIEAQTYRNWQVLAWDNGSSDGTIEELRRWIPRRLPGNVVVDRPLPLAESRARLVMDAPTELCALIDGDDVNDPRRLELQVAFLANRPGVAAVGGQVRLIDADTNPLPPHGRFPLDYADILGDMLDGPALAQPSVLFRRSAVLEVGNYRNVGPVNVEDYDLWLRLAVRYPLGNLDTELLSYRMHAGSTTIMAEGRGVLRQAVKDRFAEQAPALYGCTPHEARLLADHRHPFALPVLLRMARRISQLSGQPLRSTLASRYFGQRAASLLSRHDYVSRGALRIIGRAARRFGRSSAARPDEVDSTESCERPAEVRA